MTTTNPTRRDLTLSWTLDATPAEVFRAWTDPDHLQWFYNDGQPHPVDPIEVDLRVGGTWRQLMVESESKQYVTGGVYREIVTDAKLVFSWGAVGGWPALDPDRLDDSPVVTVTLAGIGNVTEMTVHMELPAGLSDARVEEWWAIGIRQGWQATIDRLAARFASSTAV